MDDLLDSRELFIKNGIYFVFSCLELAFSCCLRLGCVEVLNTIDLGVICQNRLALSFCEVSSFICT